MRSRLLGLAVLLAACTPGSPRDGVLGDEGKVYFSSPDDLVFTTRLMMGSTLHIALEARSDDDKERIAAAHIEGEDDVVRIDEDGVHLVGAGVSGIVVVDDKGARIDRITIDVAPAVDVELLDGLIVGSNVDPRVPDVFALVQNTQSQFFVRGVDACGGELLPVNAVDIAFAGEEGVVQISGYEHYLTPTLLAATTLNLVGPGELSHAYDIDVVERAAVDEVDVEVALIEGADFEVWARAFTDDIEVIGMSYDWDSSARVLLSRFAGPNTIATVSFPEEGVVDDRPATITAEVLGEEKSRDLLSITQRGQLVAGRVPAREVKATRGGGCGGQEGCDPYALGFVVFALLGFRRLRS